MFIFGFLNKGNKSVTGILPLDFYERKVSERTTLGIGRLPNKEGHLIQSRVHIHTYIWYIHTYTWHCFAFYSEKVPGGPWIKVKSFCRAVDMALVCIILLGGSLYRWAEAPDKTSARGLLVPLMFKSAGCLNEPLLVTVNITTNIMNCATLQNQTEQINLKNFQDQGTIFILCIEI